MVAESIGVARRAGCGGTVISADLSSFRPSATIVDRDHASVEQIVRRTLGLHGG
jgi:hypothetical protein